MKITNTTLVELKAEEGMILVGPDGYGAKLLYLGIYDSPDNYTEIPESEYVEPNPEEPEQLEELEELPEPEELEE